MTSKQVGAFLLGSFLMLAPAVVFAQTTNTFFGPIWPSECYCPGKAPGFGCILQVVQNLIRFAVSFGVLMIIFSILYAGYAWTTNAFNPDKIKEAKKMLFSSLIGLGLVLGSFLIVDFIMDALYNSGAEVNGTTLTPWNSILAPEGEGSACIEPKDSMGLTGGTGAPPTTPTDPGGDEQPGGDDTPDAGSCPVASCGSTSCRDLSANCGFNTTSIGDSTFNVVPGLETKLRAFDAAYNGNWTITAAYDPTGHSNDCHGSGTCVDVDFVGNSSPSGAQVNGMINAFTSAGLHPCWEVGTEAARTSYISQGVNGQYIDAISGLGSAWHFSVYTSAPSGGTCNR